MTDDRVSATDKIKKYIRMIQFIFSNYHFPFALALSYSVDKKFKKIKIEESNHRNVSGLYRRLAKNLYNEK